LEKVVGNQLPWSHPWTFKKYNGLQRDDKVPISMIPDIESKLKCHKINISGDYSYISTKKAQFTINLKLCREHYKIAGEGKKKIYGISAKEKIPYFFKRDNDKDIIYDPEMKKEREISHEEYLSCYNKYDSKYMLIPTNKKSNKHKLTLKELYEQFVQDAEILKKEAWQLNLYKTGTDKNTALTLFYDMVRDIIPDSIKQHEGEWLLACNTGAIIFAKPYEGPAYKYDVCSMYPSLMRSNMCFPYKEGEFKQIKELDKVLTYGIYRCEIKSDTVLFRTNFNNYYTHIDIYRARELKLPITLIHDDQPNALIYSRDKLCTGNQLFGKYVDLLFPLKQKKICDRVKAILNILWGALCERNLKSKKVQEMHKDDKEEELKENQKLVYFKPLDDTRFIVNYQNNDHIFKTDFARIKPFLLAKGRTKISKLVEPCVDNVMYIHTDGFLVTEEQKKLQTGTNLGDVKYEGFCKTAQVVNAIKVIGDFKA
jgi:hypothetical protein